MFSGKSVPAFYDSIADDYERFLASPEVNARLLPTIIPMVRAHGVTAGSILDIGCGPGNLLPALGPEFSYTGIDVAPSMLAIAQQRGYNALLGRAEDILPTIPSKSYDYTFAISSLHFVSDIETTLAHIERISRKGMLITLPDITERYQALFPVANSTHNHVATKVKDVAEETTIQAWKSLTTGDVISERIIYCKLD